MEMRWYWLTLGVLTTWRLTHLLQAEDGPWHLMVRFRLRLKPGFWTSLLDCFYCLSVWIAAPLAWWLGETTSERLLLWPAMSAAAILLERATDRTPPAIYYEESENHHAVLRKPETNADPDDQPPRDR